ncbi:hypothetical protein GA0061101_103239 [Rhizobium lusitanum]|uniref:Uncharacterized protein n=2 Tax=Rhizobium lusitanum TaxID=293958 RepID=A0A1C3US07_9HYPH|nr:hypothetical protein GA0061101_103239 [Rhizobium lusitanum]
MTRRGRMAVLAFFVRCQPTELVGRASFAQPRLSSAATARATPRHSSFPLDATMTKQHGKIGARNPFIPSIPPACRLLDWLLVGSTTVAGIVAAALAVAHQMGAF